LREVLVIEDDASTRYLVADLLEYAGFRVDQASDGLEALEHFEHRQPDLIVLDLMLPRLSGPQFLERSRPTRDRAGVPVLVVSALDQRSASTGALDVDAWVGKPLEIEDFLTAVEELTRVAVPRVLVVDDDQPIRDLLAEYLADEGYGVDSAVNIPQALASIAHRTPDLILLDLMLPGHSGWEFLRNRRADPMLARIPVLVISAVPPERLTSARDLGADAALSKPFDLDTVSALAHSIVTA
jgi:DNA-binding response OmpR family regulator